MCGVLNHLTGLYIFYLLSYGESGGKSLGPAN